MSDRWFSKHRQEWIAETVRIFGFINREHIERKFGISTPQASIDIQRFIDANPGALTYNKSAKRYEASNDHGLRLRDVSNAEVRAAISSSKSDDVR